LGKLLNIGASRVTLHLRWARGLPALTGDAQECRYP